MTYHFQTSRFVILFSPLQIHFEYLLQLVVTTTHNLLIYALPTASLSTTESPKKRKKKTKASTDGLSEKVPSLSLQKSVPLPSSTGEGSTFRAAKYILSFFQLRVSYFGLLDIIRRIEESYSAS
jgi:hypothetical protein